MNAIENQQKDMTGKNNNHHKNSKYHYAYWQYKLHEIIFEADTKSGKIFDIALIVSILISIIVIMLESVAEMREQFGQILQGLEWFFTILFTVEYILRLFCVRKPLGYAFSFFGIIDFLAIIPTYLSLFFPGGQFLVIMRILRTLRIFRILKLAKFLEESLVLSSALIASRRKITVFLFMVLCVVMILGAMMYIIEGEENGFTSIPKSIYWAIVTLTTVGYGDISPQTPLGQTIATLVMITGYGIIAVPTGIVTVEVNKHIKEKDISTHVCPDCSREGHDTDALYCKYCGSELNPIEDDE